MTHATSLPRIRRRPFVTMLATGAVMAAGAGLAVDQAQAASAQVQSTTLVVNGDATPDRIALRLEAGVPTNLQVDFGDDGSADFTFDRATFDRIIVNARRGNDTVRIDDVNGTFTDTELATINGGRDDDTLIGGSGNEVYNAGPGDDSVDGNRGDDVGFMGDGDDTFIWDPGDGNDVIEGQRGEDTMDFRGAGANETFDMTANGSRLRFFRTPGNVLMDTNKVERVLVTALGGTDTATINDLRATDVRYVKVDLTATLGAAGGDGLADAVVVNATTGADDVSIRPNNGRVVVDGLAPKVVIANSEAANDTLTLNTLGGEDTVRFGNGLSALIRSIVNA